MSLPGGPPEQMPIAIVGIGCRFPGGIVDPASFWRVLEQGVDAITEIPADRFDIDRFYDPKPGTRGRIMTRWGGFIDQRFEDFDAAFFGISRSYADRLDPQQRLLLETSWEAMEDAGLDILALQGTPTGIFVGQWVSDFEHRLFADTSGIDFQMAMGSGRYAAAGRLSYAFGFRGPSLSIDAACSSGLASVHLAVRSLRSGDSKVALAGGVNMILQPHIHLAYSYSKMMSPEGRCRFGDAGVNGYVRAEGAGMVVLKPLADAIADGDHVYAVIRGSAVNNDGDSSGALGRPSRIGQEELLRSALRDGAVQASQLDYVEAHGTGTRAGDPVELDALATVLAEGRAPGAEKVWVGSVKTNFGHAEAAAGVAGLIKAVLMMERRMIPPSLHFDVPNPAVAWDEIPIAIPTALHPWPERNGTVFAGVSSYGIGGTNAHVVLESASVAAAADGTMPAALLLPLSARSAPALRAMAGQYAAQLRATSEPGAADVCWSAATRRTMLPFRAAFAAPDRDALIALLTAYADGGTATAEGTETAGVTTPVVASASGETAADAALSAAIDGAARWVSGGAVDWVTLLGAGRQVVRLPAYPWQRHRHWVAAGDLPAAGTGAEVHASAGSDDKRTTAWRPDVTYVLVGALSELGLEIATAMVRGGARRLLVIAPVTLPERARWSSLEDESVAGQHAAGIRALEQLGVAVHHCAADPAEEAVFTAALSDYEREGWPAIDGVIQLPAARVSDVAGGRGAVPDAAPARLLAAMSTLNRAMPDVGVFVLCTAVQGGDGSGGAAASALAIVTARRTAGRHGVSVQWETSASGASGVETPLTARMLAEGVVRAAQRGSQAVRITERGIAPLPV